MPISLYNSLGKKKETLVPLEGQIVRMYSCGVTVYDKCHIGHARSLFIFDMIRKYLQYRGYDVRFIRNITDVDDKIIKKANDLGKDFNAVVKENVDLYHEDLKSLKIDLADEEPRATENIPGMIKHILGLVEKGMAYEVDGDVYFCVRKFRDYGKLSGQSVEKMQEAVRIEKDDKKRDPLDFILWKKSKEGEPSWPSPWGPGRPGWHIECSVMSLAHLGCKTLDIHAGGRDLIFPHHENEIAQAEALTGHPFARYWIHHGLLTINGQKMAKSLGNFITVQDALAQYDVEILKMFYLSSHYTSDIDYSANNLEDARRKVERIKIFVNNKIIWGSDPDDSDPNIVDSYKERFVNAMDDDFNTPKALGVLFELINEGNKLLGSRACRAAQDFIDECFRTIFSLSFSNTLDQKLTGEESVLLEERKEARQNKDYTRSDEIRDELKEMGIIVEDTPGGQVWRRT